MEDARFVMPRNRQHQQLPPSEEAHRILTGGTLPFSPISIIDPVNGRQKKNAHERKRSDAYEHRDLGSNDNSYESYLVDASGNEYEPYSLAWRYLGMYIDCDFEPQSTNYEDYQNSYSDYQGQINRARRNRERRSPNSNEDNERNLGSGDGGDCPRVLLWAAVSWCCGLSNRLTLREFADDRFSFCTCLLILVVPRSPLQRRQHWRVSVLRLVDRHVGRFTLPYATLCSHGLSRTAFAL